MTEISRYPGRVLGPTFPLSIGDDVLLVQSRLVELGLPCADLAGYPVPRVDGAPKADVAGLYGKRTYNSVLAFQKDRGLKQDGLVGSNTWQALFFASTREPKSTSVPPSPGVVNAEARDTDLARLHPAMRERVIGLIDLLKTRDVPMRLFEAHRSPERQQSLFAQGRNRNGAIIDKKKVVTHARPFESYHQYGLAVDMVIGIRGREWDDQSREGRAWWAAFQAAGKEVGLEPLSFEKPHLQLAGLSTRALLDGKYPEGGDESWLSNFEAVLARWTGPHRPPRPGRLERPPFAAITMASEHSEAIDWSKLPQIKAIDWAHPFGGRKWRVDQSGVFLRSFRNGEIPLTSDGTPRTCGDVVTRFGQDIAKYSEKHGVPPEILIMIIATETGLYRKEGFTGTRTFRWEPRPKDYSAGPMQILSATARDVNRTAKLGYSDSIFPAFDSRPDPVPDDLALYRGDVALDVGAAFLAQKMQKHGANPILLSAAYNAGGVYGSENPWGLRCHGDHLDRAAEWFGDACRLLQTAST